MPRQQVSGLEGWVFAYDCTILALSFRKEVILNNGEKGWRKDGERNLKWIEGCIRMVRSRWKRKKEQ